MCVLRGVPCMVESLMCDDDDRDEDRDEDGKLGIGTSAMRVAACLDLLVARRQVKVHQIEDGTQTDPCKNRSAAIGVERLSG